MSLAPPPYLGSLQNNIRARPVSSSMQRARNGDAKNDQIPWDGAVRAGNLTEEQLKTIKSVDKVRKEQRKQTIESDPATYANLLVGGDGSPSVLEKAQKRQDIIQYILVLGADLITGLSSSNLRGLLY